jgi:hypothetical protein
MLSSMKAVLCTSLLVLLPLGAVAALPGDAAEGQRLHNVHCTGCHDSGVYTRKDRNVRSLDALKGQLQACGHMALKRELSAAEAQNLLKYLNERFYRFR